jgi:hypothetical protein
MRWYLNRPPWCVFILDILQLALENKYLYINQEFYLYTDTIQTLRFNTLLNYYFRVQSCLLLHLGWKWGFGSYRGRRTCASTRRCRSCGAGVVAPRSSRPWSRLRRLHRQHLCGSVLPAFWSSRYVSKTPTVTTLLNDKPLGNLGLCST